MAKLRIFKSSMAHLQYLFKNGKAAVFMAGEYRTGIPHEIEELEAEVVQRHPHIFMDPARMEIDEEDLDPMVALKKKHFAEFQEQQTRAMDKQANVSVSDPTKSGAGTGIATSEGASHAAASNQNSALNIGTAPGGMAGLGAKLASFGAGKK